MKFSYKWLREYIDLKASAAEVGERLTMAGLEVESLEKAGSDWVYEVEVTPNRPDWLSILGVAREAAALYDLDIKVPVKGDIPFKKDKNAGIGIKIDTQDCPLYVGYVIENIKVKPSPKWLSEYLTNCGIRSINNAVDITNFVLLEYGQPLHAFDLDKLNGNYIGIRNAKAKEKIATLDGQERVLCGGEILIVDKKGPVALAGVMGGASSEVSDSTTRIFLESAVFDAARTRRTSRTHAISTESSVRFERKVSLESAFLGAQRAAALFKEYCSATVTARTYAGTAAKVNKPVKINFALKDIDRWLGIPLPKSRVKGILKRLGFSVEDAGAKLKITVPYFRLDISREVDIIEELARIEGFENIPESLAKISSGDNPPRTLKKEIVEKTKDLLVGAGLNEALTYTLISQKTVDEYCDIAAKSTVALENPMSLEHSVMRPAILPSLLQSIAHNAKHHRDPAKLFELSNVYQKKGCQVKEPLSLAICIDSSDILSWKKRSCPVDFYDLKGILFTVLDDLGIENITLELMNTDDKLFDETFAANIRLGQDIIGRIGKIKASVCETLDIEKEIFACELNFERVMEATSIHKGYYKIARYPVIRRDIALIAPAGITNADIETSIRELNIAAIEEITLFDIYEGKHIPEGKKGLTYALIYRDDSRTLTDEEVNIMHDKVVQRLKEKLGIEIRS